ncbi:MAG: DUF1214 domain-containing protein [Deltaproteobacteria bacterium]|nr:DUF1214 domain-containing protein [Deltaproteobacteria bacterium]MBW2359995.1 DUF1214 domain-containing protein [Deltaproteobacteria bacterium]
MDFDRRGFMRGAGAVGAVAGLGWLDAAEAIAKQAAAGVTSESRKAYAELIELLAAVDTDYLSEKRKVTRPSDISDGHRYIMHVLDAGLDLHFESNPDFPVFKRIVSPSRKANGDNPDAIYFTTAIRGNRRYRVRGNLAGATYTSFTIEAGSGEGRYASRTAGVLNDLEIETDAQGHYELTLGPDSEGQNAFKLPEDTARLTTRHYFERKRSVAADPNVVIPLVIEPLDAGEPPPDWNDARIAAGIRRVANHVRSMTLDSPVGDPTRLPSWVSTRPNVFNAPEKPGQMAFAAFDAAYSMAPYALGPDEALVIEGKFPKCRFANVVLWNRYLQSYDYVYRQISLNRQQTQLEPDGSFRMLLAHSDPEAPNWLDSMGRSSGTIYWRFMLPEGDIVTPKAQVVRLADVRGARG